MTSEIWGARYPDLAGKTAIVTGTSSLLAGVGRCLCRNGVMPALVIDDREVVAAATDFADQLDLKSFGIVAAPGSPETWRRVGPHIEQRLGPIDILVVVAPPTIRQVVAAALLPDMAARRRGVIVEAGEQVEPFAVPTGLRHRSVSGSAGVEPEDLANAIALCASDLIAAVEVEIHLG